MNELEIARQINNLNWNSSKEEQVKAIDYLSKIDEKYFYLIFEKGKKESWENAVLVIKKIGSPKNEFFISVLLWLLQDINWPGSLQAVEILSEQKKSVLIPQLESKINEAYDQKDYMWLGGLKMLVEKCNYKSSDFNESKTYSLLAFSDF